MLAVGNDKLGKPLGDTITCPHCGKEHAVDFGKDEDGIVTKILSFYNCGDDAYLCGINGKSII